MVFYFKTETFVQKCFPQKIFLIHAVKKYQVNIISLMPNIFILIFGVKNAVTVISWYNIKRKISWKDIAKWKCFLQYLQNCLALNKNFKQQTTNFRFYTNYSFPLIGVKQNTQNRGLLFTKWNLVPYIKAMRYPEIFGLSTFPKFRKARIPVVETEPKKQCFRTPENFAKLTKNFPNNKFKTLVQNSTGIPIFLQIFCWF